MSEQGDGPRKGDVIYTSRLKTKEERGRMHFDLNKLEVYLEGFDTPFETGQHGAGKMYHYERVHPGVPVPKENRMHSLEYVTTALAASSIEAVGDALEARGIILEPDELTAEVEGDFEKGLGAVQVHWTRPGRGSVLSRIRIRYHLKVPRGKRQIVEEVLQTHLQGSSIFQSLQEGIKCSFDWGIGEAEVPYGRDSLSSRGKTL